MNDDEYVKACHPVLVHFNYKHLPSHLQFISKKFHDLAYGTAKGWTETDESCRTAINCRTSAAGREVEKCLDKLLEAKDCAVRSKVN